MSNDLVKQIITELDAEPLDESTKRVVRHVLARIARRNGETWIDRQERIKFAIDLLGMNVSRSTIRSRLQASFSISRRQAYRVINDALAMRSQPTCSQASDKTELS
jgi:hypothetical protein